MSDLPNGKLALEKINAQNLQGARDEFNKRQDHLHENISDAHKRIDVTNRDLRDSHKFDWRIAAIIVSMAIGMLTFVQTQLVSVEKNLFTEVTDLKSEMLRVRSWKDQMEGIVRKDSIVTFDQLVERVSSLKDNCKDHRHDQRRST